MNGVQKGLSRIQSPLRTSASLIQSESGSFIYTHDVIISEISLLTFLSPDLSAVLEESLPVKATPRSTPSADRRLS